MSQANLSLMGDITTLEPDGSQLHFPRALLLEFDSIEELRAAIASGRCEFGAAAEPIFIRIEK